MFGIKLLFLIIDSLPMFYMGDTAAYLAVAAGKWIPPDRSFTYGFIIRYLTAFSHSLHSVIFAQVLASAVGCILTTLTCDYLTHPPRKFLVALAALLSLDPLQLVYERFIMAETFSLFFYLPIVCLSAIYLLERKIWLLIVVQMLAVCVLSLRFTLLPLMFINAAVLPVLAFWQYRKTLKIRS